MIMNVNRVLDQELLKLLEDTPVQVQSPKVKKFNAVKWNRNISTMFDENKPKSNKFRHAESKSFKFTQGVYAWDKDNSSRQNIHQINDENIPNFPYSKDYAEYGVSYANVSLSLNPYQNFQSFTTGKFNFLVMNLKLFSKFHKFGNSYIDENKYRPTSQL